MDLTDEQWTMLKPLVPEPARRTDGWGRPWRDTREVLNGVLWVLRTRAPWYELTQYKHVERHAKGRGHLHLLAAVDRLA